MTGGFVRILVVCDVIHRETKLSNHIFEGRAFILLKPLARCLDISPFFVSQRFVVNIGGGEFMLQRIKHCIQQTSYCHNLAGRKVFDKRMQMVAFLL